MKAKRTSSRETSEPSLFCYVNHCEVGNDSMTMFWAQEAEVDHDFDIFQVTNVVRTMARQNKSCTSCRRKGWFL